MTTLCRAPIRPVRLAPRARVRASAFAAPPMSSFVDADGVKAALALSCVDPSLSALVYGGRGSGKSTLCRSVASVVPEKKFITVPLGVTDERVLGSVDVEASAKTGRATYEPGLLAEANDGVLFIDDVNLVGTYVYVHTRKVTCSTAFSIDTLMTSISSVRMYMYIRGKSRVRPRSRSTPS